MIPTQLTLQPLACYPLPLTMIVDAISHDTIWDNTSPRCIHVMHTHMHIHTTHTHTTHTTLHTHTLHYTHTNTTHTEHKKQSLRQPCRTQLLLISEPELGYLCTTTALEPCAGKSSWESAGELSMSHGERSRSLNFHNDPNTTKWDEAFASPVYTRYLLMLQLGGLLLQLTLGYQVPI